MQVQVLFPALARFHNGVSLFLIMKIQRRTRGAVALEAMREKKRTLHEKLGKARRGRETRTAGKQKRTAKHTFFYCLFTYGEAMSDCRKTFGERERVEPSRRWEARRLFAAKNSISRAKAGEGRTAGSRIPVHQLIKTFLTSSHGGAMSSAAAMDLYSPGIP